MIINSKNYLDVSVTCSVDSIEHLELRDDNMVPYMLGLCYPPSKWKLKHIHYVEAITLSRDEGRVQQLIPLSDDVHLVLSSDGRAISQLCHVSEEPSLL